MASIHRSQHTGYIYVALLFLPRNLQFIGNFFMQHSNPTLELFITMGIAILVIIISLITNAMICTSPFLAHYLLGVKNR